jgi:tRNA pseudouridine38-40 synthase
MRTIKLLVAYDGTDFCGWQKQVKSEKGKVKSGCCSDYSVAPVLDSDTSNDDPQSPSSVQAVIEKALLQMHKHDVALTGAGRTDSGVHAAGQVANFTTSIKNIEPGRFVPALNGLLPRDVRIIKSEEAGENFHARFDARMRTYRYFFICGRQAQPHESRYAVQLWTHPSVNLLNSYCRLLHGEMDCSVFKAAGDTSRSANRYISRAVFFAEGDRLVFEISANAFLRKMVRSVAGTFLHYGESNTPAEQVRDIIASGDRSLAGPTLPPQGLFLWKVDYNP